MLLHMDGFDSYATTGDLAQEGYSFNASLSTTAGRYGGGAVTMYGYGQYVQWTASGAPMTEIWTGFAFNCQNPSYGNTQMIMLISPSGAEASIYYNPSINLWTAYRGNGSTVLGTATYAIGAYMYHWIEIHYKISTTVGIFELWIDGNQVMNFTGVNTSSSGGTSFTTIGLSTLNAWTDDFYVLDTTGTYNNTRLGDSRIETLRPQSDAGPNNGTPSTPGPHYAMVNELQWNSGNSIVLGSTSGNAEVFGMMALSTTPSNIHAVKVLAVAEKTDGGTLVTNAIVVSSNVEADGNSTALLTSFSHVSNTFETDPNTGVPWAYTAVNSMHCGIKVL